MCVTAVVGGPAMHGDQQQQQQQRPSAVEGVCLSHRASAKPRQMRLCTPLRRARVE